jgi:hypothetical protein
MKNKMFIVGMISVLLAAGFVFTACSSDDSDSDTWTKITQENMLDYPELLGTTWEGNTTIRLPGQTITDDFLEGFGFVDGITISSTSVQIDPLVVNIFENTECSIDATIYVENVLNTLVNSPEMKDWWKDLSLQELADMIEVSVEYLEELFPDGIPPLEKAALWEVLELNKDMLAYFLEIDSDSISLADPYKLVVVGMPFGDIDGFVGDPEESEDESDPTVEINQDSSKIRISIPVPAKDEGSPVDFGGDVIIITLNKRN